MSLEQLTEKIIKDAETKKTSILSGARSYAEKKEKETQSLFISKRNDFEKNLTEKLSQNTEKIARHAEREVKLLIDKTKRDVLNNVFQESFETIEKSSDDLYQKILDSLFKDLPKNIDGFLLTKPERIEITKRTLEKNGITCPVKEDSSLGEGFIIQGKTFEYNGTFKKLLVEKEKNLEVEIAHILF